MIDVHCYFERESDAIEAARLCSDSFSELSHRYPERFAAYDQIMHHSAAKLFARSALTR